MEKVKDLYPQIPPTVLRQRDEKDRTAKNVPFWHFIADIVFPKMVQNRFYSLIYKDEENLKKRNPNYVTICYTPHCNWWDGIFAYYITRKLVKGKFRLMIEEMNRFPLFQYIGCFPVNKKSAQTAMRSLKYACSFLGDKTITYWLFPQGIIRPPFYRPVEFKTGLAYMAKYAAENYGGVNLVPVSTAYLFLREDRPEIVAKFGEPIVVESSDFDRHEFSEKIEKSFQDFMDAHFKEIQNGEFDGYTYLYKRKLSWWKKIEKRLKNIGMKKKV